MYKEFKCSNVILSLRLKYMSLFRKKDKDRNMFKFCLKQENNVGTTWCKE